MFITLLSPYCFPQWLYWFTFLLTVQEGYLLSTPSPAFTVCRLFDEPHCGFNLQFSLIISDVEHLLLFLLGPAVFLLCRNIYLVWHFQINWFTHVDTALKPTGHVRTYMSAHVYKQHLWELPHLVSTPTRSAHIAGDWKRLLVPVPWSWLTLQTAAQIHCLKVGSCCTDCLHKNHHKNHL